MDSDPDPAFSSLTEHLHHFSKIKSQKKVTKQEESKFFVLFLLHDEGSGFRRPKNIRIRRIRIRNTARKIPVLHMFSHSTVFIVYSVVCSRRPSVPWKKHRGVETVTSSFYEISTNQLGKGVLARGGDVTPPVPNPFLKHASGQIHI